MNLPIANVIRRLRRERDKTQEELAAALGVTCQSVSRWENAQAYPDMELIPKIANYFGVTTDMLFGIDKSTREGKLKAHWDAINRAAVEGGYMDALKAALEEFPDEYGVMVRICEEYVYGRHTYDVEEVKALCQKVIENSTDTWERSQAIGMMIILEEDGKAEAWAEMLPRFIDSREVALEERYDRRGEVDKCNRQRQENFRMGLHYIFYNCVGKRDEKRYKNPEASMVCHRMILNAIDTMRDPSTDIDAWICDRAFFGLRLAAGCFGAGRTEEGYAALEKAVDLYVAFGELPEDTNLSYHCPALDLLTVNKGTDINLGTPGYEIHTTVYSCLIRPDGWEWFNSVREEDRYQAQVERLLPYIVKESE